MDTAKKNENRVTLGFNPEIPAHAFAIQKLNEVSRKKADLAAKAIWTYYHDGQSKPAKAESPETSEIPSRDLAADILGDLSVFT